jgi:hypothetical protein
MNRREFLNSALATTLVGSATTRKAIAQTAQTTRSIPLQAYSRFLHWVRTPAEVANACRELSCKQIMLTVQDGATAHVQQANLVTELPRFVNGLRSEGIEVPAIRGGNQTDVDANVERLVGTMADLGITNYWLGNDGYDLSQPMTPQLDAIKRKVERFVTLNERNGTTLMYHTRAGASTVGAVVLDLLYVLQDFDPRHVGFHWDTGHMALHGPMWETLLRAAAPYVTCCSWKDRAWRQDLGGLTEQGGPFPGPNPPAPAAAAGGGGGRGGGAGAGAGGRAGGQAPNPDPYARIPLPLAGEHFARGMGWSFPIVPLGTGVVDFFRYGEVLRDIGFNGTMNFQAEYAGLGGAERGLADLTAPRRLVLGNLKRDVLTIRIALAQSGSGIVI